MAEINNALALQVQPNQMDFGKTFTTLAQLQMAQAHANLYGLQAQQQQRQLQGYAVLQQTGDPEAAVRAGLDPNVGNTYQNMHFNALAAAQTPGGIQPSAYEALTGAGKNLAATKNEKAGLGAKIAGSVIAAPDNDTVWREAVNQHYDTFGGPTLERQKLLAIKDPNQRLQIAKAYSAGGTSPDEMNKPMTYQPGVTLTTPARELQGTAAGGGTASTDNRGIPNLTSGNVTVGPPVNAPVQQPTQPIAPQPLRQGMGPRELKAEEGQGGEDVKYGAAVTTAAQAARGVNATLGNMVRDAANLPVGRGMTSVNEGRAWLQSMYDNNVLGAKSWMPNPGTDATAAYDSMVKNSGQLTRQALMQTHERAAIAYDMIQRQLPSVETSRGGLGHVAAEWMGLNDDAIAKQSVMSSKPVAGRSDKFEAEWNKNVNPVAFMVARMSPQDRATVIQGLNKTEGGRQILADIKKTDAYLAQQGSPITPQGIQ